MDYVVLIFNGGERRFITLEDVMMDSFGPSVEVAAYTLTPSYGGGGYLFPVITEDMSKGCKAFERAIYHMIAEESMTQEWIRVQNAEEHMLPQEWIHFRNQKERHAFTADGLYVVAGFCSEYSKQVYLRALKPSRKNIYEAVYNTAFLKQSLGVKVHKRTWNTPLRMGDFLTNI
jgi:hypothetical protein